MQDIQVKPTDSWIDFFKHAKRLSDDIEARQIAASQQAEMRNDVSPPLSGHDVTPDWVNPIGQPIHNQQSVDATCQLKRGAA